MTQNLVISHEHAESDSDGRLDMSEGLVIMTRRKTNVMLMLLHEKLSLNRQLLFEVNDSRRSRINSDEDLLNGGANSPNSSRHCEAAWGGVSNARQGNSYWNLSQSKRNDWAENSYCGNDTLKKDHDDIICKVIRKGILKKQGSERSTKRVDWAEDVYNPEDSLSARRDALRRAAQLRWGRESCDVWEQNGENISKALLYAELLPATDLKSLQFNLYTIPASPWIGVKYPIVIGSHAVAEQASDEFIWWQTKLNFVMIFTPGLILKPMINFLLHFQTSFSRYALLEPTSTHLPLFLPLQSECYHPAQDCYLSRVDKARLEQSTLLLEIASPVIFAGAITILARANFHYLPLTQIVDRGLDILSEVLLTQ